MIPELSLNFEQVRTLLSRFVREEIQKTGLERAVIGLSGGIDSALVAYLTVEALGAERVHCIRMPYETSSADSLSDAQAVIDDLGCSHETVDITAMAKPFFALDPKMDNVRMGNVMARLRMVVLYDRSAKLQSLVVGTGNKTEMLLGYSTLFGDSAYAINPIGDLYKTQVFALSQLVGVPDSILKKPPSADLWSGQTDEQELGFTYEEIDKLLYFMVDTRASDTELMELGFEETFIASIRRRMKSQQFKRMPAVIAKVGSRTINTDYRYPRDWNM